jgi:hypothetical protein
MGRGPKSDAPSEKLERPGRRRLIALVAVLSACSLIPGGLALESASASAASAPRPVHTAKVPSVVIRVGAQAATLERSAGTLDAMSQMLKAAMPVLDSATAQSAQTVAAAAAGAASASRDLAQLVQTSKKAKVLPAANKLQSALNLTEQSAARLVARPSRERIKFCTIRFVAFPGIKIIIPGIGRIVIRPIIITLRVPCFISGLFNR